MTSRIRFPRSASVRLSAHMRRASSMIKDKMMRPQSERNLNSQTSSSIDTQLPRQKNVSPSLSSRKLDEPLDDEQKHSQVLSKLPASGFNRLKNLWAIRENAVGFTSPLSTWSRPYASFNQSKKDTSPKIHYDERTKTYTAKFDLDRTNESFINFGQPIEKCPREQISPYNEAIPSVLLFLRNELESHGKSIHSVKFKTNQLIPTLGGFLVEGVFRIAASFDDQKAYKAQIDKGSFEGCKNQDDTMCMAALIKEWFRTMPIRLLNILPENSLRTGQSDIDKELPEPNYSVFLWLCDLMADIVEYEQVNRMSARAMAIVIAPNLYATDEKSD